MYLVLLVAVPLMSSCDYAHIISPFKFCLFIYFLFYSISLPITTPNNYVTTGLPSGWYQLCPLYNYTKTGMGIRNWILESMCSQSSHVAGMVEGLRPFPIKKMLRWEHQALCVPSWHLHWEKWLEVRRIEQRNSSSLEVIFPGAHKLLLLLPCSEGRAAVSKSWSAPVSFKTKKPHRGNFNTGF